MPAFNGVRYYQIQASITGLFNRCLHHFDNATDFTHEELLVAFVKPEDRQMVTQITKLADISYTNRNFVFLAPEPKSGEVYEIQLAMHAQGDKSPFVVPRYANAPLDDADPEVMRKIGLWLSRRRQLAEDFGHMHILLNWCHEKCTTPAQVRFMWPGILTLIGMAAGEDEGARNLVDSLRRFRIPPTMPRLPAGMMDYAVEAEARVARALLLPRVEDTPAVPREVSIATTNGINAGPPSWLPKSGGVRI